MQKVGPRSKLRFPALYLQQLTIPHVKHGLAAVLRRVAELDAAGQFPGPGRLERCVEGSLRMRVEVVVHQGDLVAVGTAPCQQVGDLARPVRFSPALAGCRAGPASRRFPERRASARRARAAARLGTQPVTSTMLIGGMCTCVTLGFLPSMDWAISRAWSTVSAHSQPITRAATSSSAPTTIT